MASRPGDRVKWHKRLGSALFLGMSVCLLAHGVNAMGENEHIPNTLVSKSGTDIPAGPPLDVAKKVALVGIVT